MSQYNRLTQVLKTSKEILMDDSSKIVFFSDCHRGDNSLADDFSHNQNLFFHALNYYYDHGFTYIELGDGDELWKNKKFSVILEAHSDVFWLLQKFHNEKRFHMIYGNHDMIKKNIKFVQKNLHQYYNPRSQQFERLFTKLEAHEGLILKHKEKNYKIFVVHGHQVDCFNDRYWRLSRFLVRNIWKPLELLGVRNPISPARNNFRKRVIEKNLSYWVLCNKQMLITGHTHRPVFPKEGQPPYFNDGSCVHPRCVTGIEIQNGEIALIKWSVRADKKGLLYIAREVLEGPRKLDSFFN
ncbi:MAG: metallophosphoesterase family protein [Clostridia bacterium]|nr:metallophosphoesterase family protein [Clostridia bacterium]